MSESYSPKVVPFSTDAMFQMPKFEMPTMEVHPAFREFAEKGVAQAKEGYEKMKASAEKATETFESTFSIASKGYTEYGYKLIETTRANSNAAYDLFGELLGAKSYAEVVEKSTAFMRSRVDVLTAQAKELSDHCQKVATESSAPIKDSIASFNKAAA